MLSLAEASHVLGVGPEQVRCYLHRGLLPAAKIANAWVLPAAEVHALAEVPPRGGRPLSQAAAWRSILAGSVDFDDPCSYANRGVLARYSGGSGMVAALLAGPVASHRWCNSGRGVGSFENLSTQEGDLRPCLHEYRPQRLSAPRSTSCSARAAALLRFSRR